VLKDLTSLAGQMKSQGATCFKTVDPEMVKMQNEDIRNRSEVRKKEVDSRFGRIGQRYDQTKTAFMPLMSDPRDVQKFPGR